MTGPRSLPGGGYPSDWSEVPWEGKGYPWLGLGCPSREVTLDQLTSRAVRLLQFAVGGLSFFKLSNQRNGRKQRTLS